MKKRKKINPQFLFGENNKPEGVYFTIEDFSRFMSKLEKLSEEFRVKSEEKKNKQNKRIKK